ncbi:hypothetical protein V4B17_05435 [Bartonella sp. B23]
MLAEEMMNPDYAEHKELQRKGTIRYCYHPTKKQQAVGEQGVQQCKHAPKKGMATAM